MLDHILNMKISGPCGPLSLYRLYHIYLVIATKSLQYLPLADSASSNGLAHASLSALHSVLPAGLVGYYVLKYEAEYEE